MNNHIELLNKSQNYLEKNIKGGNKFILDAGFPNLLINKIEKKKYEYNIDNFLENEKINIQNILKKRKEEKNPLININEEETELNLIKKKEEYTTNIDVKDIFN